MGEVYRARDPRLGRDVAIKVLPIAWSGDPERLQRFELEARAAATLNHPNILAVFDIGQHDGSPYIVSELLDGETLRERLAGGVLPVRKAVEYAIQIARGMAAAHEKGIVHRDLKPENVFVTSDGRLKVLDFGLAKLTQPEGAPVGATALPTTPAFDLAQARPDTQPGMVLGTIGYMSPEQVRGVAADHRADIFAFGTVLYEMLSGRRAFQRETAVETMTAILKENPPDLPLAERHIPPALDRIVDRCLEKGPAERFQSAADLGFALEALSGHSESTLAAPAGVTFGASRLRRSMPWAVAFVLLVTTVVLAALQLSRSPQASPVVQFHVPPPAGGIFPGANNTPRMAISPDGQYLAFTVNLRDGKPELLWLRKLDSLEARAVPNTDAPAGAEPVQQPFWSPDSRYVGFFADGKLKKVDIASTSVQTIAAIPGNNFGGSWNQEGVILVGSVATKGLQRVSADGGTLSQVTTLDDSRNESAHLWPQFLPDGRHFLYLAFGDPEDVAIYAGALDSAERKLVLKSQFMVYFAPPDHLFWVSDGALMVQRFDVDALELQGTPIQIAEGVSGTLNGRIGITVSDTGVLVHRPAAGGLEADSQLVWLDRSGQQLGSIGMPSTYRGIELSPDDRQVAVHREERQAGGDLWLLDLVRGSTARLTLDATHSMSPVWSPDGRRIVFSRQVGTSWRLYERESSGVGTERQLYESKSFLTPLSILPDGQSVVIRLVNGASQGDFFVMRLSDAQSASPYLQIPFNLTYGQLSPDARWMAYSSIESGRNEIYVQSFPSPSTRYAVSTDGGIQPRWRRDGRELFYLHAPQGSASQQAMMSVTLEPAGAGLKFGVPAALFDAYAASSLHGGLPMVFQYAVSSDGNRFLVARQLGAENAAPGETPLTVVLNWTSLLNR